jgi:hypothetical protein
MNEPFISKGTTIYGKRTTVITAEIQAIRDAFTPEQCERLLMECARKQWFVNEHAEYWKAKEAEKGNKAHF